ncbi:hypothetical protein TCAL_11468 [Tigriopus californicus]|uniref:Carbonic anhydrase n=1 Tax=Tigriopus californicus TaxID=6832 RepID=A0A553P1Q1_TIGCA|nr:carbonic anhydrase 2-like [Tigriopus californicus]TRY71618.1 hypothetical protein TCAL_11468 [Tigriopus californicus]|eukprot:TCALIF_11468-PA protein Name:"Similar to ca2 Carbonic anhydrase 2 (Tribolodon hakonensis)" AED:0.05 eAED:0.05 QI:67/1/1/1/0.66/0.71/7/77/275
MVRKVLLIFALVQVVFGSDMAPWNYDDTMKWGDDYPFCDGNEQSPIDIKDAMEKEFDNLLSFSTNYMTCITGTLFNNGHTVQFNVDESEPSRLIFQGPLGSQPYKLLQFHLHWGSDSTKGSEHTLDGQAFPAEIHLVHVNASLDGPLGKRGDLAVVGLFIEVGENAKMAFQPLVEKLPSLKNKDDSTSITINMADILGGVEDFSKWTTYLGSLTTPGCNEIVTWINMEDPIKMAEEELKELRTLINSDKKPMVDNFRPPLELKDRKLYKNMPKAT